MTILSFIFKCDLDLLPTWANVANEQLCQIILFWNPCINEEVIAQTGSNDDHFIIWPSSVTLTFNLPEQMFQMNNSTKLFWNLRINLKVMALTNSIYDHFIIWPSCMTLTFNLSEQMFQMAFLLLKENNCTKLFWNPCINVEVMARTSSMTSFSFDLQVWPSTYLNKMFSNGTSTPQGEQLCKIILKSIHKYRSYGPDKLNLWPFPHLTFKCDFNLQPTWTNVSNGTSTPQGEHLCQITLKSMHNTKRKHIHWTEVVTTMSRSLKRNCYSILKPTLKTV